jgi:hypothetical protein
VRVSSLPVRDGEHRKGAVPLSRIQLKYFHRPPPFGGHCFFSTEFSTEIFARAFLSLKTDAYSMGYRSHNLKVTGSNPVPATNSLLNKNKDF